MIYERNEVDCNVFIQAMNEALTVLAADLDANRAEETQKQNGITRGLTRWKNMEDKKAEAAAKKKKLGTVGMKYTAQAMMDRA